MSFTQKKEINDISDIRLLVDTFYSRAENDELLSPIFAKRFRSHHSPLDPLYRYWGNVLLDLEEGASDEIPFPKHQDLPLTHQHFDRWLSLFHQTVDDLFTGALAEKAKFRAIRMSEIFRYKMELTNF
ncbi:MAG TPA: group III truncated hemoglobin [Chryseosolibacter sp.]